MAAFALTIFTGAFLLFQVQPLIGKYILPWFGGGTGVWTTCLLFFQVVLLGGYAYAHFTSRWLKPRGQAILHLALLVGALALLPITPSAAWKPTEPGNPTLRILGLLAVSLGLPYFVLSSTGPLMQQWFSQLNPGRSPYRLYALSNTGSLLALVSYPFFVENHFTRKAQAGMWGFGLVGFVVFCAACAVRIWKSASQKPEVRGQRPEVKEPELVGAAAQTASTTGVHLPSDASSLIHQSINPSIHSADPNTPRLHHSITPSSLSPIHYPLSTKLLWLLLPACASVLLLATTNKMCQDTAVIPFLWVLPLALYLLSFIICFDNPRWYKRPVFTLLLAVAFGAICWAMPKGIETPLPVLLTVYSLGLFICCMVCHGELYRLRPAPEQLTSFYLIISAGGALGGVFVAIISPLLFRGYYELHWGLVLCGLLFILSCLKEPLTSNSQVSEWRWLAWLLPLPLLISLDRLLAGLIEMHPQMDLAGILNGLRIGFGFFLAALLFIALGTRELVRPGARFWPVLVLIFVPWAAREKFSRFPHWRRLACSWIALGLPILSTVLWAQARVNAEKTVEKTRTFYGVLTVVEDDKDDPIKHAFRLAHGPIVHGLQPADPVGATWPTMYYDEEGGGGLAIRALPRHERRIGLVGLGVGTLAAYARTNDYYRFYEINPEVLRLATSRFSYLSHCYGKVEFVLGDGRLSLENEPPQHFDLLALDTFSGDAIPTHMLTREAFTVYERHMNTNGIIAVHISNGYVDLEPVLANIARDLGYQIAVVEHPPPGPERWWVSGSFWALLTHDKELLKTPSIAAVARPPHEKNIRLWTDDFASLFQILK